MTCTVSMPDSSSKNQPQLVYMSMAWRCSSSSLSARARARRTARAAGARAARKKRSTLLAASGRAPRRCSRRAPPTGSREQRAAARLEARGELVAQPVERVAQRRAPLLVPAGVPAGVQPQSLRQRSTPWAQLHELFSTISTSCGREQLEELAVVGEARVRPPPRWHVERVGERHVAVRWWWP
jgi:hypothetical protein